MVENHLIMADEDDVEARVAARAANVGDIAVTRLAMPENHRPTWRHLLPKTYFTDGMSGDAADDLAAEESSVTMGDLRVKYSGCRILEELRIPSATSVENCRLYSATYPGPTYGLIMIHCNGRVCIKQPNPVVPRFECQVGSIIVAMNRQLLPYGAPFQRVLGVLRDALRHPPVTLHYVDNEDFITFFRESFLPCLPQPKVFKAPAPEKVDGESDADYISRVFGNFNRIHDSATDRAQDFAKVISNDEHLKNWVIPNQYFRNVQHTWENIGRVLAANTNLEELRLVLQPFMNTVFPIFLTQLQANQSLRTLCIMSNSQIINDRYIHALSSYLHCDNNRIAALILTRFEFSGADFLQMSVAVNGTKITALTLDRCKLVPLTSTSHLQHSTCSGSSRCFQWSIVG